MPGSRHYHGRRWISHGRSKGLWQPHRIQGSRLGGNVRDFLSSTGDHGKWLALSMQTIQTTSHFGTYCNITWRTVRYKQKILYVQHQYSPVQSNSHHPDLSEDIKIPMLVCKYLRYWWGNKIRLGCWIGDKIGKRCWEMDSICKLIPLVESDDQWNEQVGLDQD